MKDVTVTNTSGTNRTMNTYTGISDALSDTIENFTANIYGHAEAITKPFDLKEGGFTNVNAISNSETKRNEILSKVHEAAYLSILDQIFDSICPNFLDDPERSFSKIAQKYSEDGVSITVTQYYSVAMELLNNFKKEME